MASRVSIARSLTTSGGDGRIALTGIAAPAPVGDLLLGAADLIGDASFGGTLGTLTLGQIRGAIVQIAGTGDAALKASQIDDSHLIAPAANFSLTAATFTAATPGAASIEVAGLKSLAIIGAMSGDVHVSGSGIAGYALGTAKVDGAVSGGLWSIHGRANTIQLGSTAAA